jgi:ABC-type glycerol-3-phosphate transport system substrate-binding protein
LTDKAKGIYGITLRGKPGWGENVACITTLLNTFGLLFYIDLMKADGPPGATANGFNENLTLFASGKAAIWIDSTVAGGSLCDKAQSQVADKVTFAAAPIAVTPNGSHLLWSWVFAIPKAAKSAEAAEKFALWASSKQYIKMVADDSGWATVRRMDMEHVDYRGGSRETKRDVVADSDMHIMNGRGVIFKQPILASKKRFRCLVHSNTSSTGRAFERT